MNVSFDIMSSSSFFFELYDEDIGFLFFNSCSSGLAEMIEVAFGSTESTM